MVLVAPGLRGVKWGNSGKQKPAEEGASQARQRVSGGVIPVVSLLGITGRAQDVGYWLPRDAICGNKVRG